MNCVVVIIVSLAFSSAPLACGYGGYDFAYGNGKEDYGPSNYKFDYGVHDPHTGDNKQQYEIRHGDVVKGAYSFKEADGTTRVVEYEAGPHSGFNAVVKRIGHAHHPAVYGGAGGYFHGAEYGHGGAHGGAAHSHVGPTSFGYKY